MTTTSIRKYVAFYVFVHIMHSHDRSWALCSVDFSEAVICITAAPLQNPPNQVKCSKQNTRKPSKPRLNSTKHTCQFLSRFMNSQVSNGVVP